MNVEYSILDSRRKKKDALGAWKPKEKRTRVVSAALRAYAVLATRADKGAARDVDQLKG